MNHDDESVIRHLKSEDLATVGSEPNSIHQPRGDWHATRRPLAENLDQGAAITRPRRYVAPMGTTTANDIAAFIRERLKDRALYISDRKVHALLYLAQAGRLASDDTPLFDDVITATNSSVAVAGVSDSPTRPLDDVAFASASFVVATYGGLPTTDLEALIRGQGPWSSTATGDPIGVEAIRLSARELDNDPDGSIYGYTRAQRRHMRRSDPDLRPAGRSTPDSAEERESFIAEVRARM